MSWVNIVRVLGGEVVGVHVMPSDDETPDTPRPEHIAEFYCPCRPRVIRDTIFEPPVISHREPSQPGAEDLPDA